MSLTIESTKKTRDNRSILLTIDVEDWFHVENLKPCIPFSSWSECEFRVGKNVLRILDLLDSIDLKKAPSSDNASQQSALSNELRAMSPEPSVMSNELSSNMSNQQSADDSPYVSQLTPHSSIKGTFFILGWVAERLPRLVREIHARGHEVASHGYYHEMCHSQSNKELMQDLTDSKKLLEDIIGAEISGYRAPSFSINDDILKIVKDCGYRYDSSYNSFGLNKRYGKIDLSNYRKKGIAVEVSKGFYEIPISNLRTRNYVLPWGGGGYFRLIPLHLYKLGVWLNLKREKSFLFYMHPWEIDPEQPRVKEVSIFYRFRHYLNLHKTLPRLSALIKSNPFVSFLTCKQYLDIQ